MPGFSVAVVENAAAPVNIFADSACGQACLTQTPAQTAESERNRKKARSGEFRFMATLSLGILLHIPRARLGAREDSAATMAQSGVSFELR
jgi:hypothetical protein